MDEKIPRDNEDSPGQDSPDPSTLALFNENRLESERQELTDRLLSEKAALVRTGQSLKVRAEKLDAELAKLNLAGPRRFLSPTGGSLRAMLSAEGQGLPYLGFRLFKWLILIVIVMTALIPAFAIWTAPNEANFLPQPQASGTPAPASPEQAQAWNTARTSWVASLKDLGQLYLLTPIFPLIGAVIGYIFGRDKPTNTQDKSG